MQASLSLRDVCRSLGVVCEGEGVFSGAAIDSREVLEGNLFFALPGKRVDGHAFLEEAAARGALGAVVSKGYEGPEFGLLLLYVEDVRQALWDLGRDILRLHRPYVIAVTGSVGKTTTKEWIATLLEGKYRVGKSPKSHNTDLSLPLTIVHTAGQVDVLVLEFGLGAPKDVAHLVDLAPPDMGVLLRIGMAHTAQFSGGIEEIAREKGAIFSRPETKVQIFEAGLFRFPEEVGKLREGALSFSVEDPRVDFFLSVSDGKVWIDEKGVRAHSFALPFEPFHLLPNLLAAIVVARQMKRSWSEIEDRVAKLVFPKMRFERVEKGGALFVNDAYNANPESMRAALQTLKSLVQGKKRIAVLGSMKELGAFSKRAHQEIGECAASCVDHLLAVGEEAKDMVEAFSSSKKPSEWFPNVEELVQRLSTLVCPGDVVLVKGSRALGLERVLERIDS